MRPGIDKYDMKQLISQEMELQQQALHVTLDKIMQVMPIHTYIYIYWYHFCTPTVVLYSDYDSILQS